MTYIDTQLIQNAISVVMSHVVEQSSPRRLLGPEVARRAIWRRWSTAVSTLSAASWPC